MAAANETYVSYFNALDVAKRNADLAIAQLCEVVINPKGNFFIAVRHDIGLLSEQREDLMGIIATAKSWDVGFLYPQSFREVAMDEDDESFQLLAGLAKKQNDRIQQIISAEFRQFERKQWLSFTEADALIENLPLLALGKLCDVENVTWVGKNCGGFVGLVGRTVNIDIPGSQRFKISIKPDMFTRREERNLLDRLTEVIDMAKFEIKVMRKNGNFYNAASRIVDVPVSSEVYNSLSRLAKGQSAGRVAI